MARPLYSDRVMEGLVTFGGGTSSYVVPPGQRLVVMSLTMLNVTSPPANCTGLWSIGGSVGLKRQSIAPSSSGEWIDLRWIIRQGEALTVQSLGGDFEMSAHGYLLLVS